MKILNQNGQAVVAALVMLPLVLAICFGLAILGYALTIEAKATAACRASLIESQRDAAYALEQLLALNALAETAEASVKALNVARFAMRATGAPPFIAAAEIAYKTAKLAQGILRTKQLMWLARGKAASKLAPYRAAAAVQDALPKGALGQKLKNLLGDVEIVVRDVATDGDFSTLGSIQQSVRSLPTFRRARFHVIASPPGARTPTYRTAPDFGRSQRASAHWLLSIRVPGVKFVPRIELGCAATLKKNGGQDWAPQITEDKLLLN